MNPQIARQVARDPAPHGRHELEQALRTLDREMDAVEARQDEDRRLRETGERT